jgi:Cu+-exporting ATPase
MEGKTMATVTDPVCEMQIDSAEAAASEYYKGKTYYFCSGACQERFVASPAHFAV